jgi:hypothetical protein
MFQVMIIIKHSRVLYLLGSILWCSQICGDNPHEWMLCQIWL